jgi:hypothetical protein
MLTTRSTFNVATPASYRPAFRPVRASGAIALAGVCAPTGVVAASRKSDDARASAIVKGDDSRGGNDDKGDGTRAGGDASAIGNDDNGDGNPGGGGDPCTTGNTGITERAGNGANGTRGAKGRADLILFMG